MNRNCMLMMVVMGMASTSSMAGQDVQVCRDADGNPYFTDKLCPDGLAAEEQVYIPNAQGYTRRFTAQEVNALLRQERRAERLKATRSAESASAPSYEDRVAARNAAMSVRNDRDMYRHRKNGPRDAAELAIEYNAESFAKGGRHQVRVPDVTNRHEDEDR